LSVLGASVGAAVLFSLFVLIGNPLIVLSIMGALGYRKRTGFLAGLTVAQISEFSLIFMAMGVSLGHVEGDTLGLVALVGLITIAASTYMITYSHELYGLMERALGPFERKTAGKEEDAWTPSAERYEAVIFGLGRYGLAIASELKKDGARVLGVDFDPVAVSYARQSGHEGVFGDSTDPEFLAHLPLKQTGWAISTLPQHETGVTHDDTRRSLLRGLRDLSFPGRVAVAAHSNEAAESMRALGADLVLMPYRDAASEAASLVMGKDRPSSREPVDPVGQKEFPS